MAVSGLRLQWQLWKCNGMEESGKLHIELVHLHCRGDHGDGGASLLDWGFTAGLGDPKCLFQPQGFCDPIQAHFGMKEQVLCG